MKTNHRRGFVARGDSYKCIAHGFVTFHGHGETTLSGRRVNASATLASENSRGVRRDRAGAKKFIHSRTRFHEDAALRLLIKNGDFE
jgi:hypothetical protein